MSTEYVTVSMNRSTKLAADKEVVQFLHGGLAGWIEHSASRQFHPKRIINVSASASHSAVQHAKLVAESEEF